MTRDSKTFVFGLCDGRHDLPVDDFIFGKDDITFPIDPTNLKKLVINKFNDVGVMRNDTITIYVTGLTPALTATIRVCFGNGIYLNLKHYDRDSGNWIDDNIFNPDDRCDYDAGIPAWFAYGG